MEIIIKRGCGLDVHKEKIVACVMGDGIKKEIRTFGTFTKELEELKKWLQSLGVSHVAVESTGIYWKPVFNILEDGFEIILANPRHIKHVPGRKTDVCDSEWLCKLLRNGLIQGSFIPPKDIRELRDLTRYKTKLVEAINSEKQRIEKVLQTANIKISSVITDSFGINGSKIIEELIKEESKVIELVEGIKGKLKKKKDVLKDALEGRVEVHHKFMIKASLEHIKSIGHIITEIDKEIDKKLDPYRTEYELLQTIPGVKEVGAATIIAEIGVDMDKFPTEAHLSSWAGISPGNNESAGKKKSTHITHGDKSLKRILIECAWAVTKSKHTYLRAKYYSLIGRRGKKRALVAVGHKILIACYHILKNKVPYKELGEDYLDNRNKEKIAKRHIKRLRELGFEVTLEKAS